MYSLEKSMFFIPNRFYTTGNEMYVSFNIAVIPKDTQITSMILIVPMPADCWVTTPILHEINQGWDEQYILTLRPLIGTTAQTGDLYPSEQEARFSLDSLSHRWRFDHYNNHGVYVRLPSSDVHVFTVENPPYLLINTV